MIRLLRDKAVATHLDHLAQACQLHRAVHYQPPELFLLLTAHMRAGACTYCRRPLSPATADITWRNPPSRGGPFRLDNLTVSCTACHTTKGILDDVEYRTLRIAMANWEPAVQELVLAAIRQANAIYQQTPPPATNHKAEATDWIFAALSEIHQ